jgi:hypothetical protein
MLQPYAPVNASGRKATQRLPRGRLIAAPVDSHCEANIHHPCSRQRTDWSMVYGRALRYIETLVYGVWQVLTAGFRRRLAAVKTRTYNYNCTPAKNCTQRRYRVGYGQRRGSESASTGTCSLAATADAMRVAGRRLLGFAYRGPTSATAR